MTNQVAISGRIEETINMSEGIILGKLRCNDLLIDVFWEEENFSQDYIEKEFVCVQGRLIYIKYKKEGNDNVVKRLAICVERMEIIE